MTYQEILEHLNQGCYFYNDSLGFRHTVLAKTIQGNIFWCHYGESANKCNLKELQWIITEVFCMTAETFSQKYKMAA